VGDKRKQTPQRRAASHLLHVAFQLKGAVEERIQAETGYLMADNEALLNLTHHDAPLRMSEIANRLILSKGGTTKVIDRLEADGLVERSADPTDMRALVVSITPNGRDLLARIQPIVDEVIEEHFGLALTAEEAELLIDISVRVAEANDGWVD
jgi:DNA-binding MarR family transcriptional regulator